MAGGWLDIRDADGERRHALAPGLTRVARDGDVRHPSAGGDELHVWDKPPRAIYVGGGDPPMNAGAPVAELPLTPGARIDWRGMSLTYGGEAAASDQAALEEVELAPEPVAASPGGGAVARPAGLPPAEDRIWRRLKAGMYVELGLADRVSAKRWQDAVVSNAFDPDKCADDILARSGVAAGEPRVLERSGRLLRDLLMAPLLSGTRGATRRARQATKGFAAMIVSQLLAFLVFSAIVLAALCLLRLRGSSIDAFLDVLLPGR